MSEGANSILKFRRTPAINQFLLLLDECSAMEASVNVTELGLNSVESSFSVGDKPLLHLILTACVDEPSVKATFALEENQDLFAALLSTVEGITVSRALYSDIITALGLDYLQDCLCLILANPSSDFSVDTMEHLVAMVSAKDGHAAKEIFLVLATLLEIFKLDIGGEFGERYMDCFQNLAHFAFLQCIGEVDKVLRLFKLLAIALLHSDDEDDITISRLIKEWGFPNSSMEKDEARLPEKTLSTYQALFRFQKRNKAEDKHLRRICQVLHDQFPLNSAEHIFSEVEEEDKVSIGAKSVTRLQFASAYCYFIQLLLQRHSIDRNEYPKFCDLFEFLLQHKPKLTDEELVLVTESFQDFYSILMRRRQSQDEDKDWKKACIDKFLSFRLEDILGSGQDGLKAASKLFGVGKDLDCEPVVVFICKVTGELDSGKEEELPEDWKEFLLTLVMDGRWNSEEERSLLISAVFDGQGQAFGFGLLQLPNFEEELNTVLSQVMTIEKETNAAKLAECKDTIMYLCLQNPLNTIRKLLEQSIRVEVEEFRALGFSRPCFTLKRSSEDDPVLMESLLRILKQLPEYPGAFYDSIGKSFSNLISGNFLKPMDVFSLLRGKIMYLMERKDICMNSILGAVALLEWFCKTPFEDDESLQRDVVEFIVKLSRFFCQFTTGRTFSKAMQIREKLIAMQEHFKVTLETTACRVTLEDLEEKDLSELGLLYIRVSKLRPVIESLLRKDEEDNFRELDLPTYVTYMTNWILNSCESEWHQLNHLVFDIGYPLIPRLKRFRKIVLLNKSLLAAYVVYMSADQKQVDIFSHVLRFYSASVAYLKSKKAEFTENDWIGLTDTLLSLGVALTESRLQLESSESKKKAYQLSAMKMRNSTVLYKILNLFLKHVEEYGKAREKVKMEKLSPDSLLVKVRRIRSIDPKCESVMWVVKEMLKKMSCTDDDGGAVQELEIVA